MLLKMSLLLLFIVLTECGVMLWAIVPPSTHPAGGSGKNPGAQQQALEVVIQQDATQQKRLDQALQLLTQCREQTEKQILLIKTTLSPAPSSTLSSEGEKK